MALRTGSTDWFEWHDRYEDADGVLGRRLELVQARLRSAIDRAAEGPVRLISVCAGQGRDVAGALRGHPRAADVSGRLVERDPRNTEAARGLLGAVGASHIEVVTGDAALTDSYAGVVPADVVLLCGVLGNISDEDAARTIDLLSGLCAFGASVIWTRGRRDEDHTPAIRWWFEAAGFEEHDFSWATPDMAVGVHHLAADPVPVLPGTSLFTFVGYDALVSPR